MAFKHSFNVLFHAKKEPVVILFPVHELLQYMVCFPHFRHLSVHYKDFILVFDLLPLAEGFTRAVLIEQTAY